MSDELNLSVGDVVNLKSGGPLMTIERIEEKTGSADCSWFMEGVGYAFSGVFPLEHLERAQYEDA